MEENQLKKNCCNDCKEGQPGQNKQCKARLLAEKIHENVNKEKYT